MAKTFISRANTFLTDLEAGRYPNATSLSKATKCSENTAQRTIYRVRDELMIPFDYDASMKGYYLTSRNFKLPEMLPPGKDELVALLLARELVSQLDAPDLHQQLSSLWFQMSRSNSRLNAELLQFVDVFSSDSTAIGIMADGGLLDYIAAAQAGEAIRLRYQSPWRHTEEREYLGRVLRVHFSDGSLYILFEDDEGKQRILNAAFVRKFEIVDISLPPRTVRVDDSGAANWLQGFGIWAGERLEDVEIRIAPPAARYYAAQRWNDRQEDTFDGDILVRRFPAMLSPELVRRLLSLGRHLVGISPEGLREKVREEVEGVRRLFSQGLEGE